MNYEPLRVACIWSSCYSKDRNVYLGGKKYFQVRSTLLGNCNHEHETPSGARDCLNLAKKWMKQGRRKMECPRCHEDMGWNNHGICEKCGEYCGCSFDPTSYNDYCSTHDPRVRKVIEKLDKK